MGNSHPTNKTGRKVVAQKLEHAKKTGILSLCEHKLDDIPNQVFDIVTLKTLDLSKNSLSNVPMEMAKLQNLKSLNLESNELVAGSLTVLSKLKKLQTLNVGKNSLGRPAKQKQNNDDNNNNNNKANKTTTTTSTSTVSTQALPPNLPTSIKQLKLDSNCLSNLPMPILSLSKLEKLDLSHNHLASLPNNMFDQLKQLTELILDSNVLVCLPKEIGTLQHLKQLSLKQNHISGSGNYNDTTNPQPIPATLFTDTPLIDLNLHGNPMTSTQLNDFDGYAEFLKRREKVKSKGIYGGALTNLDVCGLE